MSDEISSRRNFLETIGGFIFLVIIASLIFGGKENPSDEDITAEEMDKFQKLTESAATIASFLGYKRFSMIVKIGRFLIDLLRPTPLAASDVLPTNRDSINDLHAEMQRIAHLYFEKRYDEAINHIKSSAIIFDYALQNDKFRESIEMITLILQELIWIDNLASADRVVDFGGSDPIFNFHKTYLSVWYGKTERSDGLEQCRTIYQSLNNEPQDMDEIAFKEIGVVFATLVFNYDFENDRSLPSYDSAIQKASLVFAQINLPTNFKEDPIIADQWNNLELRLKVFDSNTNADDRSTLENELRNSTLESDEKYYLIGVNALYANKPEDTIRAAEQIESLLHRQVLLAYGTYLKAKNNSDTSDETQAKIKEHFESIRNSDKDFFCQLYHNNTPIFGYVYESREWYSLIKNIFSDSEIEEIENSCKGL
jgi:hypothetical protein